MKEISYIFFAIAHECTQIYELFLELYLIFLLNNVSKSDIESKISKELLKLNNSWLVDVYLCR